MKLIKSDVADEIIRLLSGIKDLSPEAIKKAVNIAFNIVNSNVCDDCGAKIEKGVEFSNNKEYDERNSAVVCEDCLVKALGVLRSNQ